MWKEILALSNTGQANKELITWQSVEDILLKLAWRKKFLWDHQVTVLETVSFSSMPSEKKVSSAADCLAFMQGGCELMKVRPNSRIYSKFYTLDPELACLRWEPSKKDGDRARLDISAIREVRTGKSTETFLHNGPLDHLAGEAV